MAVNILQIAYHPGLLEVRKMILEKEGYDVVSVLGNDQGVALARTKTLTKMNASEKQIMKRFLKIPGFGWPR
jgi:hypothetical protein